MAVNLGNILSCIGPRCGHKDRQNLVHGLAALWNDDMAVDQTT